MADAGADTQPEPKSLSHFFHNSYGWTFNLVTTCIVFWVVGFPLGLEYGYSNDNYDENGAIPSGPEGSGAFVITLFVFLLCSIIYALRLATYFGYFDGPKAAKEHAE